MTKNAKYPNRSRSYLESATIDMYHEEHDDPQFRLVIERDCFLRCLGGQLLSPRDINTNEARRQNPAGIDSRHNSKVSEDITQGAKPLHKDLDRWISGVAGHHSLLGISSEYREHSHCAKSGLGSTGLFGVYHKWSQGA